MRELPSIFAKNTDSYSGSVIRQILGGLRGSVFEQAPQVILMRNRSPLATWTPLPAPVLLQPRAMCSGSAPTPRPRPWAPSQDAVPPGLGVWFHSAAPSTKAAALFLNFTLDFWTPQICHCCQPAFIFRQLQNKRHQLPQPAGGPVFPAWTFRPLWFMVCRGLGLLGGACQPDVCSTPEVFPSSAPFWKTHGDRSVSFLPGTLQH